jgi:molybdate transport system ATP-binding protein
MNTLDAQVALERGAFRLDVNVRADASGITSLVGPSGAGKTTLLRCIAGLEPAARGRIVAAGETWLDGARSLPAHRRRIGYVFQEASLFAHLSVRGNLEFGWRRVPSNERRVALDDVVAWLELGALLARRTHDLSGGERQRVALGRALLASPKLLLVDEPLSALDTQARERIAPWIAELPQRFGAPVLHVSHSLAEVARFATQVVQLEAGRITANGAARDVLPHIGASDDALCAVLAGRILAHDDVDGLSAVAVGGTTAWVRRCHARVGASASLTVFARDVALALSPDAHSSILNEFAARVAALHEAPTGVVVTLELASRELLYARISRRSARVLELDVGTRVFARVKGVGVAAELA